MLCKINYLSVKNKSEHVNFFFKINKIDLNADREFGWGEKDGKFIDR